MKINSLLKKLNSTLWEMSVKTEFKFEFAKMNYKTTELYSRILVDNIAPYYFAVVKEAKYCDGLDELQDKYRASLEYQPFAYSVKDYSASKAKVLNGVTRNFADYKVAVKWLRDQLKQNFEYTLKEAYDKAE